MTRRTEKLNGTQPDEGDDDMSNGHQPNDRRWVEMYKTKPRGVFFFLLLDRLVSDHMIAAH